MALAPPTVHKMDCHKKPRRATFDSTQFTPSGGWLVRRTWASLAIAEREGKGFADSNSQLCRLCFIIPIK
jgi:hypothetical protein